MMLPSAKQVAGHSVVVQDASSSVAGRRRGRPHGSKNKPKLPVIVNRESTNTFVAHILKVNSGCDVVDTIGSYSHCLESGVCILSGSGTVSKVSLRLSAGEIVNLEGRFEILSLSGSFLPPPIPSEATSLTLFVLGELGQVICGSVQGVMMAAGPVMIVAALFTNFVYKEILIDEEPVIQMPTTNQQYGGESRRNPRIDPSSALLFLPNVTRMPYA